MPRQPRALSETGIYHVMFRGVNHCLLFEESVDFEKLLALVDTVKTELSLEVFAYCLMSNHAHLLMKEASAGDISLAMKKILSPYAFWFNKKYGRSGALITNRYKSECVTDDAYLLTLVRYVHRNPVAAGLVARLDAYPWSSYRSCVADRQTLADVDFVLSLCDSERTAARKQFVQFHDDAAEEERPRVLRDAAWRPDTEIGSELATEFDGLEPSGVIRLPRRQRDLVLGCLRRRGFSIRQIERVTGVPRGIITRSK